MKKENIDLPRIGVFQCTKKLFFYYLFGAVVFNSIFWGFFGLDLLIKALDVALVLADYPGIDLFIRLRLLGESVLVIVSAVFAVTSAIKFYGILLNMKRISDTNEFCQNPGNSLGVEGDQGVGKTRFLVYMTMQLAPEKLEKMLINYYTDYPIREELELEAQGGNIWQWVRFKSREEAYEEYFENNPGKLPGVYSDITISYKGKTPYALTRDHFAMKKRLFESNVKLLSEADNILPNTLRRVKPVDEQEEEEEEEETNEKGKKKKKKKIVDTTANDIDEFLGLDRQYTDGTLLSDSHDNGAIYKSVRDCQQLILDIKRSEYKYTPKIISWLDSKLEARILKKGKETSVRLRNLKKKIEKIKLEMGVTKLYYVERVGRKVSEEKFFVLPNSVPYAYDTRALQTEYHFAPKIKKD